jgi:hypothetical protein
MKGVDGRDTSAFTRVFDALSPAMTTCYVKNVGADDSVVGLSCRNAGSVSTA